MQTKNLRAHRPQGLSFEKLILLLRYTFQASCDEKLPAETRSAGCCSVIFFDTFKKPPEFSVPIVPKPVAAPKPKATASPSR